ncbi:MAG: hypothetical protein ACTSQP_19260 [Promethearchaeota archaeon]
MWITITIPSIPDIIKIIPWEKINFLNYFKCFSFLIGLIYLPGSSIYHLFFKNFKLFKDNSFLFKITIYPLISYCFLGTSVLILDRFFSNKENIISLLFLIINFLFLGDIIIQIKNKTKLQFKGTIYITKKNFLIIILIIGFFFLTIGIQYIIKYIYVGDIWYATKSALYLGKPYLNFYNDMNNYQYYPFYWGSFIYSLNIMTGIPYININTLLIGFCYIYIGSTYFLIKTILDKFSEKYILLATLFVLILQLYFYIFFLQYKAYGWSFLYLALSFFLIILKRNSFKSGSYLEEKYLHKIQDLKLIIIIAFFLIVGYMTYIYPLIIGLILLLVYCIFQKKEKRYISFKILIYLNILIIIFIIPLDLLFSLHLNAMLFNAFLLYFQTNPIFSNLYALFSNFILYLILILFLFLNLFCEYLFLKTYKIRFRFKIKYSKRVWFFFSYIILTFYLILIKKIYFNFFLFDNSYLSQISNEPSFFNIYDIYIFIFGLIILFLISLLVFLKKRKISFFLLIIIGFITVIIIFSLCQYINSTQSFFSDKVFREKFYYYWFSKISIFIPIAGIFSSFFLILYGTYLSPYLCQDFLTCYLDVVFRFLGLIGIIAIFLSYYSYKKDKKLFFLLLSWIVIIFFISSFVIYYQWFSNFPLSPTDISLNKFNNMINWYLKIFRYSYPALGIIASISIFEFINKIKKNKKLKRRIIISFLLQYLIISTLCFNLISELIVKFKIRTTYVINEEEIEIINWVSGNLPYNSNIIIPHNKRIAIGLISLTYTNIYYYDQVFKKEKYNQTEFKNQLNLLKLKNYQYILLSQNFYDMISNGSLFIKKFFNITLHNFNHYNISYTPIFH